ncbi:alpha/beta-hydrolase, partial [Atractiella rhizophila]
MPRIPYAYPAQGTSAIADAIRARRGARGLTPLDGALLNAPEIAGGWNQLLGAVRTKSKLPGGIREILVLRVAALNKAYFEWIHHYPVAQQEGVSVPVLSHIRDTTRAPPVSSPLDGLQRAAVAFADASTVNASVPSAVFEALKKELGDDQQMTEAAATVATYNMVSRFLVAMDVDDAAGKSLPYPGTLREEKRVKTQDGEELFVVTHSKEGEERKWILLVNSLLTNLSMWDDAISRLVQSYNVITYDQRGHGQSSIPKEPCTIESLSNDITAILSSLSISHLHSLIGISQGGATVLHYAASHPSTISSAIVCDTQIVSPAANAKAWNERIALAKSEGMVALSEATIKRWFPLNSAYVEGNKSHVVRAMIEGTSAEGFEKGARALQGYDLSAGVEELKKVRILLSAGERDGKLPEGLNSLKATLGENASFTLIEASGHLPPIERPGAWCDVVERFL